MRYKYIPPKLLLKIYPRTISYVIYVLLFAGIYTLNAILFPKSWNFALFFLGFGVGCMMVNYSCETWHNAEYRKRMVDETITQIMKEHQKVTQKIVEELNKMHTNSVVAEAERIKKSSS